MKIEADKDIGVSSGVLLRSGNSVKVNVAIISPKFHRLYRSMPRGIETLQTSTSFIYVFPPRNRHYFNFAIAACHDSFWNHHLPDQEHLMLPKILIITLF